MPFLNFSGLNLSGNMTVEPRLVGPAFAVTPQAKIVSTGTAFAFSMSSDSLATIVGAYGSAKAFIYEYSGTDWIATAELTKSGRFGYKVAIDGTWAVVSNTPASGNGAVYIFRKVSGNWVDFTTINTPDTSIGSGFASSVALSNGTLVIGHRQANTVGGVHVYVFNGTAWVKQGGLLTVTPASTRAGINQNLGTDVAIYGDTLVAGGSGDTTGRGAGMAFVSKRTGSTWSAPVLIRPTTDYLDGFGWSVRIRGTKAVIGAPYGNATDKIPGRVFLYDTASATPTLEKIFTVKTDKSEIVQDTLTTTSDSFGWSVDINPDLTVIAAGATGRNGNRGATYVFEKFNNVWGPSAIPNSRLDVADATTSSRFGSSVVFAQSGILAGAYGTKALYWFK